MSDNVFEFPKGTQSDSGKQNDELLRTVEGLEQALELHGDDLRSILFVMVDNKGTASVGYGGEFATADIVGIIESIKMELVLRSILAGRE